MNSDPSETRRILSTQSRSLAHYPAIKLISTIAGVFAWISLFAGFVGFVRYLKYFKLIKYMPELALPGIAFLFGGVLSFLFWLAVSELFIVFVDVSVSTNKALKHLTEKDNIW